MIDRIPHGGMEARLEQSEHPGGRGGGVGREGLHPRRGRMTVVTWIGIFPLVYVYGRVVSCIMPPDTPILLRTAVITAWLCRR